jgi:hypothetical protein
VTLAHLARTVASVTLVTLLALAAPARALQPGEEVRISFSYLHLPSGVGTISIGRPDGGAWPLVFEGRSGGLVRLFDFRERLTSWWDPSSRLPWGTNLAASEMGDRHDDETRFDRGSLKATVKIARKGKVRTREVNVPADALDVPSLLMFLRLQPLAVGQHYAIALLAGRELYQMDAEVVRAERLETGIGDVDALAVRLRTVLKGKNAGTRDAWLWFSADDRHIPLRVTADLPVGSMTAEIEGYRPGSELATR